MKVVTVVGARPQFIKAAAVSREIAKHPEIKEIIVHTGQHFDSNMSEIFFREMEIPHPHYHLEVHSLGHGAMTGRMLEKIEAVLVKEQPDFVMVYGDTNSTLAGALAAKKLHIKVIHVEAGLRSFNMLMPEEINRILVDRISDILCCPTDGAVENLRKEGFENFTSRVVKAGDVMQDAVYHYRDIAAGRSKIIESLGLFGKEFVLGTIHRAENTDELVRLRGIIEAFNEIGKSMRVILPLHPRTLKILATNRIVPEFEVIEPVGYFDMLELLRHTRLVITDSGGLQKEAYFFARPCVTLRDETEWVELIEMGCNVLAGSDKEKILQSFRTMLSVAPEFNVDLYGNGEASMKIVRELLHR
jgi:UDP-GlcNAc3NAcA epimerase